MAVAEEHVGQVDGVTMNALVKIDAGGWPEEQFHPVVVQRVGDDLHWPATAIVC